MNEREKLLEEIYVAELLIKENPCGMNGVVFKSIAIVIKGLLSNRFMKGASRTQVARYLGRDVRTLTRWQKEYDDFPKAGHDGHLEVSYNWWDVVKWRLKHNELYKG